MPKRSVSSRRQFLQGVGATLSAAGVVGLQSPSLGQIADGHKAFPPHRPINLPGLHAYAQKSVSAGGTVQFRVSSTVPYQLSVRKLGADVDGRASDQVLHTFDRSPPNPQPIFPGSYVHVERGISSELELNAGSL